MLSGIVARLFVKEVMVDGRMIHSRNIYISTPGLFNTLNSLTPLLAQRASIGVVVLPNRIRRSPRLTRRTPRGHIPLPLGLDGLSRLRLLGLLPTQALAIQPHTFLHNNSKLTCPDRW